MKICTKCNIEKILNCFRIRKFHTGKVGLNSSCKECESKYEKEYSKRRHEKRRNKRKQLREAKVASGELIILTPEQRKSKESEYNKTYWQKRKVNKAQELKEKSKIYRQKINNDQQRVLKIKEKRSSPKYLKSKREWEKKNKDNKTNYYFSTILRRRLLQALKKNQKSGSAVSDLGCSIDELKVHLESKFQEGMSWDNYGKFGWHIDHIIPLSSFDLTDREQFLKACHYTNLQPLWAIDNLRKSDKIL